MRLGLQLPKGKVLKLAHLKIAEVVECQRRGYFDEHLATLYAMAYGEPYLCRDKYLVYHDSASKAVSLTLFPLDKNGGSSKERLDCLREILTRFEPSQVIVTSPSQMPSPVEEYVCEIVHRDSDYQISLGGFDESLGGGDYKSLRYRVNHARRCGYSLVVGKSFTPAHINVLARFLVKSKDYEFWDYQLYLALSQYVSRGASAQLFNVFLDGLLVGFDVVDALGDVLCVPLGFYLDYPSVGDFLIYREILHAKRQGFRWLDIGWACNAPGLREFKVKWRAVPRFDVCVQVFRRRVAGGDSGKLGC